jgi:amino acid adenylation domain-containing protein
VALPRDGSALPLSFAQQRLWFIDQLEPGSAAYNMPFALRLRGRFDPSLLERAVTEIVRRHETLRTVFATVDGEPVQVVRDAAPVALPVTDLRSLAAESREAEVRRLARQEAVRPFDLAEGPLLRVSAVRLDDAEWAVLFTMHHIVSDGWSMGVLIREVSALYDALETGREAGLPELAVQYADFAAWQHGWLTGETLEAELGFWRDKLADAPPLLELPTDRPRPQVQDPRGASARVALSAEVSRGLRALSRREGATAFMTLLAAWQLLLSRYAGVEDVSVGTPIAGRTRLETEPLIGFFVNTLVLRVDLSGDVSFRDLLGRVRETTLGAYQHQEIPFERLVEELAPERSMAHSPLFQVMFALQNNERGGLRMGALEMEPLAGGGGQEIVRFDLTLALAEDEQGFAGALSYRAELWDTGTIARLLDHFGHLLEQVATDAERRLSGLSLLRGPERTQVLEAWNRTAVAYPGERCVHELIAEQAARTPGAPAVRFREETLTYRELDRRANQLAHHLRRRGVGAETRVGVLVERGVEMIVGVLGVLKAGGAYLPLDPASPPERLARLLRDADARVLLTRARLDGLFPATPVERVRLDADWPAIAREPGHAPEAAAGPDSLAYVIYTSGSTGTPKGVGVSHRSVVNHLWWVRHAVLGAAVEVLPATTPLFFDASVKQVLGPLLDGRTVWVMDEDTVRDPAALLGEIAGMEGLALNCVPSLWRMLLEQAGAQEALAGVRTLLVGGEALPPELVEQTFRRFPGLEVWNLYGPTETTVNATAGRVQRGRAVEIGHPVGNASAYVLDTQGNPAPAGVPGELYVGGAGVARGYLGRPELTAERFVPDAFSGEPGGRLYRTGDRVRWTGEGHLEYLGRVDLQVKLRGYRIEPGEVEAVLREAAGVADAVVLVREERLAAYLVGPEGTRPAAGVHGAGRLGGAGFAPAHRQRQAGPAGAPRARAQRGRVRGAAHADGRGAGGDLGCGAEGGARRGGGRLLPARRALAAGRAAAREGGGANREARIASGVLRPPHRRAPGCCARGAGGARHEPAGPDPRHRRQAPALLRARGRRGRTLLCRTGRPPRAGPPLLRAPIPRTRRRGGAPRHHRGNGRRLLPRRARGAAGRSLPARWLVHGRGGGLRDGPAARGRGPARRAARAGGHLHAGEARRTRRRRRAPRRLRAPPGDSAGADRRFARGAPGARPRGAAAAGVGGRARRAGGPVRGGPRPFPPPVGGVPSQRRGEPGVCRGYLRSRSPPPSRFRAGD